MLFRSRLEGELAQGSPPLAGRALAAAELRISLWTDLLAEPDFRDLAQQDLAFAEAHGAPAVEVDYGRARLALSLGDLDAAVVAVDRLPAADPRGRELLAQIHIARGHGEQALATLEPLMAGEPSLSRRLLWASALTAAGRTQDASAARAALVASAGDEAPVFLARHEERWEPMEPLDRDQAIATWLEAHQAQASPRTIARAQTVRAGLAARKGDDGRAAALLDAALGADPGWGPALYLKAGLGIWSGELEVADAALARCLELRRQDAECQRGLVQLKLEQGLVEDAANVLPNASPALEGLLDAWVAVARGEPARALASAAPVSESAPDARPVALVWYVRGLALREQGDPAADDELRRAFAALLASRDWMDRRLAAALAVQDDAWTHAPSPHSP